jgi:uncharacterized membrane protein YoaK (UPF0700 family)
MARSWGSQWFNHPRHGPLPALLLLLTIATGVVDAVSILALGRVFIANMTGNVVFVGFALAGAPGFSLVASLLALAGFLLGAAAGGPVITRFGASRGRLLAVVVTAEMGLLAATVVIALISANPSRRCHATSSSASLRRHSVCRTRRPASSPCRTPPRPSSP